MERIADIFGQGLFMIFKDLLAMTVVFAVMFYLNFKLSMIVLIMLPLLLYATRIFQKYMKKAFEEVRTEVSNLNSFVQERLTGMKILQIFTREDLELKNFKAINERHKKGWVKTVWYNSIFFPLPDLVSSSQIDDTGTHIAESFKGNISFDEVHFSYVEDEKVLKGIS